MGVNGTHLNIYYEAVSNCELEAIPLEEFRGTIKSNPDILYTMLQKTLDQFVVYITRVDNLSYKKAGKRLAYRLLLLANRTGESYKDSSTEVLLPDMTVQEISETINLTRETTTRELVNLETEGIVKRVNGRLLVDTNALQAIVGIDFSIL